MKINKELLYELVCGGTSEDFEIVQDIITDTTRWSIIHDCVIKDLKTGAFYDASFSKGATEMQDESPFEYDPIDEDGNLTLKEVEPFEVTVTRYREKE